MVPVSFCTTKQFRNGEVTDYTGAYDVRMFNWIMQRLQPGIKDMTCDDLKDKVTLYKTNAIYFG